MPYRTLTFYIAFVLIACGNQGTSRILELSEDQVLRDLKGYFALSRTETVEKGTRRLWKTEEGAASIGLVLNKKDRVIEATLAVALPEADTPLGRRLGEAPRLKIFKRNVLLVQAFMLNAAPQWKEGAAWAISAMEAVTEGREPPEVHTHGLHVKTGWSGGQQVFTVGIQVEGR